jgi:CheY-like chemotaxis protein
MASPVIAVVDDNERDIELFTLACEVAELPVAIRSFTSGSEAIEEFRRCAAESLPGVGGHAALPRAIFLDLNIPGITGFDVLAFLKADASLRGIPAFILTTSAAPRDREVCKRMGTEDFLIKPSTFADLVTLLAGALTTDVLDGRTG